MRRMITDKQIKYIDGLKEVAGIVTNSEGEPALKVETLNTGLIEYEGDIQSNQYNPIDEEYQLNFISILNSHFKLIGCTELDDNNSGIGIGTSYGDFRLVDSNWDELTDYNYRIGLRGLFTFNLEDQYTSYFINPVVDVIKTSNTLSIGEIQAFNTATPSTIYIEEAESAFNEAYGITNTSIKLTWSGLSNEWKWDSDDESYVLQGTYTQMPEQSNTVVMSFVQDAGEHSWYNS